MHRNFSAIKAISTYQTKLLLPVPATQNKTDNLFMVRHMQGFKKTAA
jgi:hypothetical protein